MISNESFHVFSPCLQSSSYIFLSQCNDACDLVRGDPVPMSRQKTQSLIEDSGISCGLMGIGETGFEPAASCSQSRGTFLVATGLWGVPPALARRTALSSSPTSTEKPCRSQKGGWGWRSKRIRPLAPVLTRGPILP